MFKRLLTAWLVLWVSSAALAQDRPQVVVVNYPLQYVAERLLGGDADVVFPIPADVDPSFWRPSIADISMIQSANLILLNGAGFATWIDRVSLPRSRLVNTTAAIQDRFIYTESITHSHGEGEEHSHEGLASYTWLDPSLALAQAEAVAAAITARGIAPASAVAGRMAALKADLDALDSDARMAVAGLQTVPIITTHPRYQYLARRYDLSISSLEWEAGAMPNSDEIDALKDLIAQTGAGILIWEADPGAAAFDLAQDLGLQSLVFAPLAHQVETQTFLETFADGLSALADAKGQ